MSFRRRLLEAERLVSFSDVYLVPRRAHVEPHQVSLATRFSRSIALSIPVASSPMDTVSGPRMAIAMALKGGIGVLHRNCSVDEQVEMARRVKEAVPIPIEDLYVYPYEPCGRVLEVMRRRGVREIPVINEDGKCIGRVLLSEVIKLCKESAAQPIESIVVPSKPQTLDSIEDARRLIIEGKRDAIAIVDSDGRYLGTLTIAGALEEVQPLVDEKGELMVAAAVSPFDIERAKKLDKIVDALVSDVAHFHNDNVIHAARRLVKEIAHDFVAGNIGTYEAARDVVSEIERVDGLRVGIGGGSICTTPEVGGVYAPTLWAVASVRDALEEMNVDVPIIADGGIRTPGDAVKALAAGASCVMLGFVLAGTDEAEAPLVVAGQRMYKPYRGMASRGAMERRFAADRYTRVVKRAPEGVEGLVPYKGPVFRVLDEFVEGIKAGLGYAGARSIEELWRVAVFGYTPRKSIPPELRTSL